MYVNHIFIVIPNLQASTTERHNRAFACYNGAHPMFQHSRIELQPFLDRLTTRSILSDEEQEKVLDLPFKTRQLKANLDFVRLNQSVDYTCLVADGLVGRFDQDADGKRQIIAFYIAGDMPNLSLVVQPRGGLALQTLTKSTILEVPHSAIHALAAKSISIAEALWRDCVVDAMILAQWVVNIGSSEAKSRIAHLLCEMASRLHPGTVGTKVAFDLPITQMQIADATGLTPVHVNRTLQKLKEIGTTLCRGTLQIEDWDALATVGRFDPAYLQMNVEPAGRMRVIA